MSNFRTSWKLFLRFHPHSRLQSHAESGNYLLGNIAFLFVVVADGLIRLVDLCLGITFSAWLSSCNYLVTDIRQVRVMYIFVVADLSYFENAKRLS